MVVFRDNHRTKVIENYGLKGSCQKDGKACTCYGCGRLMIQKGKAYSIEYLSMHESVEITASAFSRPITSFYIRKITYKEKTMST